MMEAFSIGIRLSLVGNVGHGLLSLSNAFIKTDAQATKLKKTMESIHSQATKGAALMGAGLAIAASFKPAVDQAVKLEQSMNRLKALNLGRDNTALLTGSARSLSKSVKGLSVADAVAMTAETQSITSNVSHTQEILPMLAKIRFGMEGYMAGSGHGDGHGAAAESQFRDIVKAMELRGLMRNFNDAQAHQLGDLFVKSFVASGGQVNPTQFLNMMKTGGIAGKSVDNDFMFALGHMMQESGGSRTGTALMSGYQNLVAGRTTQQVAEELAKLGLLNKKDIKYDTTGKIKKIAPGALKNTDLFQSNPLEYMNTVLLPAMAAKGVDISDQKKVLPMLNTMFSNRTASNFFGQMYMERSAIGNYVAQAKNVKGVDGLYNQVASSTMGNVLDAQAKYDTLMSALGTSILPVVNKALEKLIPAVQKFTDYLDKNPKALDRVTNSLIGFAGALVFFGTLNLITAGFRSLGLALMFQTVGGFAGIFRISKALIGFSKAMAFSQIGGPGGIIQSTKNFGGAITAFGVLSQAAAVFAAAYIGWEVGKKAAVLLDKGIQKGTGDRYDTLGGVMYDLWNPYDSKNHKRVSDKTPWGIAGRLFSGDPLSRASERAGMTSTPIAPRPGGQTIQVNSSLYLSPNGMRQIATGVTTHQVNAMNAPMSGLSTPDTSQFGGPIGLGYGN